MEEWTTARDMDDDDIEEEVTELGEQLLDRLSRYLGGETILPVAFATITELIKHQDWRYRHAALKGMYICMYVCVCVCIFVCIFVSIPNLFSFSNSFCCFCNNYRAYKTSRLAI